MYIIKVMKRPYREGEHLRFMVYKEIDEVLNGTQLTYETVEHYEHLRSYDEHKVGYKHPFMVLEETEHEVFFSVYNDYEVGLLTRWAINIVDRYPNNYNQQYDEFINRITQSPDVTRIP